MAYFFYAFLILFQILFSFTFLLCVITLNKMAYDKITIMVWCMFYGWYVVFHFV